MSKNENKTTELTEVKELTSLEQEEQNVTVLEQEEHIEELGNLSDTGLKVNRKPYKYNNKEYFGYFAAGKYRGRQITCNLVASDNGGYEWLSLIFEEVDSASLFSAPYTVKDKKTGKENSGNSYFINHILSDGMPVSIKVKPQRNSDNQSLSSLMYQASNN